MIINIILLFSGMFRALPKGKLKITFVLAVVFGLLLIYDAYVDPSSLIIRFFQIVTLIILFVFLKLKNEIPEGEQHIL